MSRTAAPGSTHWSEALRTLVDPALLSQAEREEQAGRDPLAFLVSHNAASPLQILASVARQQGSPFVPLRHYRPDEEVLSLIPYEMVQRFHIMPLFRLEDHLYAAVCDMRDVAARDFLRRITGLTIKPLLALRSELEEAVKRYYLHRDRAAREVDAISASRPEAVQAPVALTIEDDEAPVIRLVDYILAHAIHLGASDIHFEPGPQSLSLRYRVDGTLHDYSPPPFQMHRSLVSRLKIKASLDISEKRLPQDGRMTFHVDGRDYDLRISIIPSVHGESVVVRILDTVGARQDLAELGFEPQTLERYEHLITRPYGMILVTGPTGSGKSTTLYTTLRKICSPRRKVITLEDPVECHLAGVTQFQVNPAIGFTFSQGLRAALRHDPDVLMLGEIRDAETAEIALRSSLTGHLLFATLHTNSAALALTRLVDMGIPHYLVIASLVGVVGQRLLRRLCLECRVPAAPSPQILRAAGVHRVPPDAIIYGPSGCPVCGHLGYRGRLGIHELLEVTPQMRRLSPDRCTPEELVAGQPFSSMRDCAIRRLLEGVTSLEEVMGLVTGD